MKREQIERGMEMNRMIEISRKMKAMMIYLLSGLVYVWMMSCAPAASPSSTPIVAGSFSPEDDIKITSTSGLGVENAEITVKAGVGEAPSTIVIEGLKNSIDTVEWVLAIAGREGAFQVIRGASISFATPGIGMYASITQVLSDELVIMDEKTGETMTYKIEVAFIGVAVGELITRGLITAESFRATFAGQDGTVELTGNVIKITNLNNQANGADGALALSGPSSLPTGYGWTGPHAIMDPDGDVTNVANFRLAGVMIYEKTMNESGLVVPLPRNTETFTVTVYLDEPLTPIVSMDITAMFAGASASTITVAGDNIIINGFRNIGDAYVIDATDVVTVTDQMGVFTSTTVPDPLVIENPTGQSATDEEIGTIAVTPTGETDAVVYKVTIAFGAALEVRMPGNVVEGSPLGEPIVLTEGVSRTEVVKVRRCGYFNPEFVVLEGGEARNAYSASITDDMGMPLEISPYYDSATVVNNTNAVEIRVANAQGKVIATLNDRVEIQECQANENGFAEGAGTPAAPWIVDTDMRLALVSRLVNVDSSIHAGHIYKMTVDIDLGVAGTSRLWTEASGRTGFTPIGYTATALVASDGSLLERTNRFRGTFDCENNTINNLYINNEVGKTGENSGNYVGLFGVVGVQGVVRGCVLENAKVTGVEYIGGLVGRNFGRIENSSIESGAVAGSRSSENVGGLVGASGGVVLNAMNEATITGTISESYAQVNVTGNRNVGGLVGLNDGLIEDSYATGDVVVAMGYDGVYVGGLVGRGLSMYSKIISSYATGVVTGGEQVGGLIGYIDAPVTGLSYPIEDARATGAVSGLTNVGGLVGYIGQRSGVSNSEATGSVTGGANSRSIGGLVGTMGVAHDGGRIEDSTARGNVTGGADSRYIGGLVGLGSGTIIASDATGDVTGTNNVGGLLGVALNLTITNKIVEGTINSSDATGNVTGETNVGGLVGQFDVGGKITGSTYSVGTVIGNERVGGLIGKVIFAKKSLVVSDSRVMSAVTGTNFVGGLIGLAKKANIEDSHAMGNVTGDVLVGGLLGSGFNSDISGSHATGIVTGESSLGGLVGRYAGETASGNFISRVTDSSATGNVGGTGTGDEIGGLIGSIVRVVIRNSYATGTVTGANSIGGLVGLKQNGSSITNSYATGAVTGMDGVGGLLGKDLDSSSSVLTSNYATGAVSGRSNVGGLVGLNTSEIGTSYASGAVTGTGSLVGGLIGSSYSGTIKESYASGDVIKIEESECNSNSVTCNLASIGGLVGQLYDGGSILSSYATGAVTGITMVGGLVGHRSNESMVTDSYAVGAVTAPYESYRGGLVGYHYNDNSANFINSYWDIDATEQREQLQYVVRNPNLPPASRDTTYTGLTTGRTTAQMQVAAPVPSGAASVYVDWNMETVDPATTKAGTWEFSSGSYPKLLRVVCANRQYADPVPDCQ